ncbi:elongation of very long chain fatty acids protein AAEL008004-like [Ischnura elegans]|uniref:elongation of very long chain fatty acids protein AAEL008004-like n=1 Tax=Ischnura elegans TaxID=197161 RepID=UPI001ED892F0|nr:elongation of very long chain fatty acids protein AAEL008004-like [Ischnura elegans]XP_046400873.1 elongation of very long chain fatty acids protein AAEL008004-like [Ischnura elegans]
MANLTRAMVNGYQYLMDDLSDPRTSSWPLVGSPFPGLCILAAYLYFVRRLGPSLMANRPAMDLRNILVVYNAFQVVVNAWLFYECLDAAWLWNYNYTCQPVDYSDSPDALRIARGCYYYFLLKIMELLDTVFFILRKKFNQVSFLHVYHHTGMVALAWGGTKYLAGGHGTFTGLLNTFIHIVMYSYYLMTNIWPEQKGNIWWKKYITQMQMVQFALISLHSIQILFRECSYPKFTVAIFVPQNVFMLMLFWDFYRKCYWTKKSQEAKKQK